MITIGGTQNIKSLYLGDDPIKAVYRGEDLIWRKARLPDAYQEVEWIKNTNNQYIDTTFHPNMNTDDFSIVCEDVNGNGYMPFACGTNTNDGRGGVWFYYNIFGSNNAVRLYDTTSTDGSHNCLFLSPADTNKHHFEKKGKQIYTDEEVVGSFPQRTNTDPSIDSLYIFACNHVSDVRYRFTGRIYSMAFSRNGINVFDLVPCYRKSDNVIGMYDLCGSICPLTDSSFYINAGSGAFAKGGDV